MKPNLLHSFRPDQVSVTMLGGSWDLCGGSAWDWLGAVGWDLDHLTGIIPGMIGDDDLPELFAASWRFPDSDQRMLRAAQVALERGSGRDWVWTYNLSLMALQGWQYVNGTLLRLQADARQLRYPDWLDVFYSLLWERNDESDRKALDFQLTLPPKNMTVTSPVATRRMLEAFAAD